MIKTRKQMFIVIGAFLLMLMLGTTTYAFFNYTRTGSSNSIRVGSINFVARQTKTINLTNVFPIDKANVDTDTSNVDSVVIEIEGDTDYSGGIEYLVSSVNTNINTTSGLRVPISLNIEVSGLGDNSANYFTNRNNTSTSIYKQLVGSTLSGNQMLLVGYIKPNTTSGQALGVDGNITIKAYLDKNKILISDTYDGTESDNMGTTNSMAEGKTVITTNEWNSIQTNGVSFQIKIEANEGIWVNEPLDGKMRRLAVMDNINSIYVDNETPGIDFSNVSSDTNGKGLYTRAGTENDEYPIIYYRGEVNDNNVMFGNKCWKMLRTTDTGGIKMIYNGEIKERMEEILIDSDTYMNENGDHLIYDSTDDTWNYEVNDGSDHEFKYKVPSGSNYSVVVTGTTGSGCGLSFTVGKDGTTLNGSGGGGGGTINFNYSYGTLTSDNLLDFKITGASSTSQNCTVNLKLSIQQNGVKISKSSYSFPKIINTHELTCNNSGLETQISLVENGNIVNKFAFNTSSSSPAYIGYMYGDTYQSSFTNWSNGALYGSSFTWDGSSYKLSGEIVSTADFDHRYSCNSSSATGTCNNIRYLISTTGSSKGYLTLSGGVGSDVFANMNRNEHNSNAKSKIDTWYAINLDNYTSKLEDTIWCNDRSIIESNGASYLDGYIRVNQTFLPSLNCVNRNDRFTVSSSIGNGALTYPVGMITVDEIMLAGGRSSMSTLLSGSSNPYYYLNTGQTYYTMTPATIASSQEFTVSDTYGGTATIYAGGTTLSGLRPVISIKPGQKIVKGTGTANDPYVIE